MHDDLKLRCALDTHLPSMATTNIPETSIAQLASCLIGQVLSARVLIGQLSTSAPCTYEYTALYM